jgi:hypothetical protein
MDEDEPELNSELYYNRQKYSHKFKRIIGEYIGMYQIDLIVWQNPKRYTEEEKLNRNSDYNKKKSRGGIYIMVVLDVYSRLGGAFLIKHKTPNEVLNAYKYIIKNFYFEIEPHTVVVDGGKEFLGIMKKFFDDNEIKIILAKGDALADKNQKLYTSLIERFNTTIRSKLNKKLGFEGKITQDKLEQVIKKYNETKHSGINEIPYDVFFNGHVPSLVLYKHNI